MKLFLCHNTQDKPLVEQIAIRLKKNGYEIWFDKWNLIPGDPWQEELEEALKKATCVVVFLGDEVGPWQNEELRVALEKRVKGTGRVVPVLLPGAAKPDEPEESSFLERLGRVTFRNLEDEDAFYRLRCGIEGKKPGEGQKTPTKTNNGKSASFRVLVLATDKDLGQAREQAVAYLCNVLAMDAVAGSPVDLLDPEAFDLVILIQAFWWDGGDLVRVWEKVESEKRVLFLAAENEKWPPRMLTERTADERVEDFRINHSGAPIFKHPDELTRLIGEAAEKHRREQLKDADIETGLSEAERAYLEMRLNTWKAGRTGAGKGFTGPDDIYEERFYVPLDGATQRWNWDKKKGLFKAEYDPGKQMERAGKGGLRKPLAWWVSQPKMAWLVISGSPGGGKTVFLTRLAAALADFLLGGQDKLEPHLAPGGLKVGQRIPVPVTLEATALAEGKLGGFADLARAVHEELCCTAGLAEPPARETTERALKAGHYLILIDALDEVPARAARKQLLCDLKGFHSKLKHLRLVLTTRSARYTGEMAFGPQFELLGLTDLNEEQVAAFCRRFSDLKGEPPAFLERLQKALAGVNQRAGSEETRLLGNPLLLATACSLFYKLGHLPNDRAALCYQVVEHLCQSKLSRFAEDDAVPPRKKDWNLPPEQKRDLLERIALAMQEEKAQDWPLSRAYDVVAEGLAERAREQDRVEQYVKWLVEHTGLLYMQAGKSRETLRFHHRLFREYLAACRLTKDNKPIEEVLDRMMEKGRLIDPSWLDVVRLLPGAMNNADKARLMATHLEHLAKGHPDQRGRLSAILAATLVESEHLFRLFGIPAFVAKAVAAYEAEGRTWDTPTRLLLLESLGWLGDPRPNPSDANYWIPFRPGKFTMGDDDSKYDDEKPAHRVRISRGFWLGRYPVTNGEYRRFVEAGGYQKQHYWSDEGRVWLRLKDEAFERWFAETKEKYARSYRFADSRFYKPGDQPLFWEKPGFNNPNQPVVGICWLEAEAYCRWLTEKMAEDPPAWWREPSPPRIVLPTEAEWEYVARGQEGRPYPWRGKAKPGPDRANYQKSKLEHTTPVGAYPKGETPEGLEDMAGNVWEWCRDYWSENVYRERKGGIEDPFHEQGDADVRALRGGAWLYDADSLRASVRNWNRVWLRFYVIGFCCCLSVRRSPEHG